MNTLSTRKLTLVGLCAALMVIFSQLTIPFPGGVPITLQTFGVILIGVILEERLGAMALGIFTLLGAIGLPVFAGFKGGLQIIFGPTGGFIIGFIVLAYIVGLSAKSDKKYLLWIGCYVGLIVSYGIGVVQLSLVAKMSLMQAVVAGALPFILKDIILTAIGIIIGRRMKSILTKV